MPEKTKDSKSFKTVHNMKKAIGGTTPMLANRRVGFDLFSAGIPNSIKIAAAPSITPIRSIIDGVMLK